MGWAIDDHANVDFAFSTLKSFSFMQEAGAGWVRIGFRLGNYYQDWVTPGVNGLTALQRYDVVVDAALSAGLKVLGLIGNETWPGNQSQWTQNNAEHNETGDGDNVYLLELSQAACTLIEYFTFRIDTWEIWNEPNAWTDPPSNGVYSGGSFIYPSNFAQLLHHIYNDAYNPDLGDLTIVSGGLFGHDIGGQFSTGAEYLASTYNTGIAHANWNADLNLWGNYPFDAIGYHLYINQGGPTSASKIRSYFDAIMNVSMENENGDMPKPMVVTEVGWTTKSVSQAVQAANVQTLYETVRDTPYVTNCFWFTVQDNAGAGKEYGLVDASGNPKSALASYQQYANF
jgi:hypothetical protein